MACSVDHLSVHQRVRVLQDFTDARAAVHRAGEEGVILALELDYATREILLQWQREAARETLYFSLTSRTGPGNGRMKEYFALDAYVDPGRPGHRFIPNYGYVPLDPPELPPVSPTLIHSGNRFAEALHRVHALAGRRCFDEAEEQLRTILNAADRPVGSEYHAAGCLCALAKKYAFAPDATVYQWLEQTGLRLWYGWGAGATSGGEGACRATEIRAAEAAFEDLDRIRAWNL